MRLDCSALDQFHFQEIPRRANPEVRVVGNLQCAAARTFGEAAPRVRLHPPGDAPEEKLLVVRPAGFTEDFAVLLLELPDRHVAQGFNPLAHGCRANYIVFHVVNPPSHDSLFVSGQSTTGGGGSGNRSRRYAVARTVAISRTASARSGSRSFMSGLLGGHPRRCPLCGRAPSGGIIDAVVSASVHYIRGERGRCLIRGQRPRASVNKRWKTESETQRTGRGQSGTRKE